MLVGGEAKIYVDEYDFCQRFGVFMTDESERHPPEKRTNYVELPAVDGVLDASEMWTDDVVFGMRQETLVFFVPDEFDFETVKTEISNFIDGRRFDYSYSFDPGYTLNGRFRVVDYSGWHSHRIEIEIDADPWKRGSHVHKVAECAGGELVTVENSRRHVGPIITVPHESLVEYNGRVWEIPEAGSWRLDMRLQEGRSQIYINTAPQLCDTTVAKFISLVGNRPLGNLPKRRLSYYYFTGSSRPIGPEFQAIIDYDLYDL